jgi:asparagine synthase (glutamine-hydrolysing)
MCGIAGSIGPAWRPEQWRAALDAMQATLRHRGPDDSGIWFDAVAGVGLCHRRLSIIDLSREGRQPMQSPSGRYVIVYNGEVYNYRQIRTQLADEPIAWRGDSDTEVVLAAIERWGLRAALERFNGMFAFALWDRRRRSLSLVRDRMGIKPLYLGRTRRGDVVFGSELKALRSHPDFEAGIDRRSLTLFLRFNCIPAPHTIYTGVEKVLPGQIVTIPLAAYGDSARWGREAYWSIDDIVENGLNTPFEGDGTEAADQLEALLADAVALRMVSDVPLGAFLSGGVDSSTVVALMQSQSSRPIKTFTIGLTDSVYDEAQDARRVARALNTDHTELVLSPRDVLDAVPRIPLIYDEPFSDDSQLPTLLVSELTRRHVTVSLSGDGGDELFGGYNRHNWGLRLAGVIDAVPASARRVGARLLTALPPGRWDSLSIAAYPWLPRRARLRTPGEKLHKLAEALSAPDARGLYGRLVSHWQDPASVVVGGEEPPMPARRQRLWELPPDLPHRMMALDAVTYLPDDILVKLDRASMAVALEARVPLIDYRLVAFAWRLPLDMKINRGVSKWILRQVLYRHVDRSLVDRPKMGFAVPVHHWLRNELKDWAAALLDPGRLRQEGFFDPQQVQDKWSAHQSGRMNWRYHLWDILMFQAWLESQ